MLDVRLLVGYLLVGKDVLEYIWCFWCDRLQLRADLVQHPRSDCRDIVVELCIGGEGCEVVVQSHKLDLIRSVGVEGAQPAQNISDLAYVPLWSHLRYECVRIAITGAKVVINVHTV